MKNIFAGGRGRAFATHFPFIIPRHRLGAALGVALRGGDVGFDESGPDAMVHVLESVPRS